jgi:hypothetical protein
VSSFMMIAQPQVARQARAGGRAPLASDRVEAQHPSSSSSPLPVCNPHGAVGGVEQQRAVAVEHADAAVEGGGVGLRVTGRRGARRTPRRRRHRSCAGQLTLLAPRTGLGVSPAQEESIPARQSLCTLFELAVCVRKRSQHISGKG